MCFRLFVLAGKKSVQKRKRLKCIFPFSLLNKVADQFCKLTQYLIKLFHWSAIFFYFVVFKFNSKTIGIHPIKPNFDIQSNSQTMQKLGCILFFLALPWISIAQPFVANYDEAKVPVFTLPDLLVFNDGTPVANKKDWDKRRSEIYSIFEKEVFGAVSYTHLRAHETGRNLVCRLLLEKKKK